MVYTWTKYITDVCHGIYMYQYITDVCHGIYMNQDLKQVDIAYEVIYCFDYVTLYIVFFSHSSFKIV